MNELKRERARRVRKLFSLENSRYMANTRDWATKYAAQLRLEIAKIDLEMALVETINAEAQEQYEDYLEAKHEYRDWLVDNDCSAIVPTYWHGRALANRPDFPTYHSRLGRVSIPEND